MLTYGSVGVYQPQYGLGADTLTAPGFTYYCKDLILFELKIDSASGMDLLILQFEFDIEIVDLKDYFCFVCHTITLFSLPVLIIQ